MAEIMIVDDDVQMVELIKHIMEVEGYGVVTAHSGRECLERIVEKVPDLILLDMKVQGMDGREVLREINRLDGGVPVVFLSAIKISLAELIELKDRFNVHGYLVKPVTKKDLLDVIGDVLS